MRITRKLRQAVIVVTFFVLGGHTGGLRAQELAPYRDGLKYGYQDTKGSKVIPARFDLAFEFSEGLAWVMIEDDVCVIDSKGIKQFCTRIDSSLSFHEGFCGVKRNHKWGYIDTKGKQIVPFKYDNALSFVRGLALVEKKGRWGFIDTRGKTAIPLRYESGRSFQESLAAVKKKGKWGYIDSKGKTVIPFKFDAAWSFEKGKANVKLGGKQGFIDKQGNPIIPIEYEDFKVYHEGLTAAKSDGKWGYIDKDGKQVIPPKYDEASSFDKGTARVVLAGKSGTIDKQGKEVVPIRYEFLSGFYDDMAQAKRDGKYCAVSRQGVEALPCQFDFVSTFSQGHAYVEKGKKYGVYDKQGKEAVPIQYKLEHHSPLNDPHEIFPVMLKDDTDALLIVDIGPGGEIRKRHYDKIFPYHGGSSWPWPRRVMNKGKIGYIDVLGREEVPVIYDKIELATSSLYLTEIGDKKGLLWFHGRGAGWIPAEYDSIEDSSFWPMVVGKAGKFGVIDNKNTALVPIRYDFVQEGHYFPKKVGLDGKFGYVNKKGREFIPVKYQEIFPSFQPKDGTYRAKLDGKWGFIDRQNKVVIPIQYDGIWGLFEGVARYRLKNNTGYIHRNGKELGLFNHKGLKYLNVKKMQQAWYYVSNQEPIDDRFDYKRGQFQILVLPRSVPYHLSGEKRVGKASIQQYLTLVLINDTGKRISINGQDGSVFMIQEAKDQKGKWRPIEFWRGSGCGMSYRGISIGAGKQVMTLAPRYKGSLKTQIRFKLNDGKRILYTKPFSGSVNPVQFKKVKGEFVKYLDKGR